MRLTAFFKLYKICILLHRCNLKIFAKNRFEKSAFFVKILIQQTFCKCRKICKILTNFKIVSLIIWYILKNAAKRIFSCENRCRYSRKRATSCRNCADRPSCRRAPRPVLPRGGRGAEEAPDLRGALATAKKDFVGIQLPTY